MRNVVKGFQISKMAVPKVQAAQIQQDFDTHHAPSLSSSNRGVFRLSPLAKPAARVQRVGKNPGVFKK